MTHLHRINQNPYNSDLIYRYWGITALPAPEESLKGTAMPLTSRIPLIDLTDVFHAGPSRDAAVAAIRLACEDVGFLVVTGHGISSDVLGRIENASRDFFRLPLDEKMQSTSGPGVFRGFSPPNTSALAQSRDIETPPDLCEAFSVNRFDDIKVAQRAGLREGRESFFAPNVWPENPPGFKGAFESYYADMEDLAKRLMGLMASALELDEDWFDDKIRGHITNLTINYYRTLDKPALPGQFRRGEHTD